MGPTRAMVAPHYTKDGKYIEWAGRLWDPALALAAEPHLTRQQLLEIAPGALTEAEREALAEREGDIYIVEKTGGIIAAYSDGGVMSKNPSYIGGAWAWCHVGDGGEIVASGVGVLLPTKSQPFITNNYSEMVAAIRALEALPEKWHGAFYCDSEVTLGRLFKGWAYEGLPEALMQKGRDAVKRLGPVAPVLLGGHPTKVDLDRGTRTKDGRLVSQYNVWCDQACTDVMRKYMMERREDK